MYHFCPWISLLGGWRNHKVDSNKPTEEVARSFVMGTSNQPHHCWWNVPISFFSMSRLWVTRKVLPRITIIKGSVERLIGSKRPALLAKPDRTYFIGWQDRMKTPIHGCLARKLILIKLNSEPYHSSLARILRSQRQRIILANILLRIEDYLSFNLYHWKWDASFPSISLNSIRSSTSATTGSS